MNINDFNPVTKHPFGTLQGYRNACEKESVLAFILRECQRQKKFDVVWTNHNHPTMVSDGLLEKVEDKKYKLTTKAIGLLYSVYGKDE